MTIHFYKDEIIIENINFTAKIAQEIADKLNFDMAYTKITFKNVSFDENSISTFCNELDFRIRDLKRIMFQFYDTKISSLEMKCLSKIFPFFTKIHFQNAGLDNDSITIISEYIKKNPTNITTVHLENNRFGTEGHHALIDALFQNDTIDKLFLRNTHDYRNGQDFTPVYQHLSQLLHDNSSIKILGLQESYVYYPLVEYLFNGIEKNNGLHKIDLGNNFFALDKRGYYSDKFAEAIKKQGLINQFTNDLRHNPHIDKIQSIINEREVNKAIFFEAVSCCDIEKLKTLLADDKVNMHWTTADKGYNALHLLALSKQPLNKIENTIKLLYQHNFKELLYKYSARNGGKLQPMELANDKGTNKVAKLLLSTKSVQFKAPAIAKASTVSRKNYSNNYKSCGLFSKSLYDTTEFPALPTAGPNSKG